MENRIENGRGRISMERQSAVAISYSTVPNENRSVRASSSLPNAAPVTCTPLCPGMCRTRKEVRVRRNRDLCGNMLARRHLGETEVENLGLPPIRDKNIRWLYISMHDSALMRGCQRVGNFNPQIQDGVEFQGSSANARL